MSLYELQNVAEAHHSNAGSGDSGLLMESDRVCEVCYKGKGIYSCPKCHLRYCALSCYRDVKHMRCYEDFYKDLVHEELSHREVSRDDREEILAMVERAQHQTPIDPDGQVSNRIISADQGNIKPEHDVGAADGDSDDEPADIMERLRGIDLDDEASAEAVWRSFTTQEKKDFEASIADGRMGNMLTLWEAWWDMEEPNVYPPACIPEFRALYRSRPNLSKSNTLGSGAEMQSSYTKQAPALQYNMLDLVMALVYTLRSFNGDLSSTSAYRCLLEMSAVLSDSAVHESASEAVQSFVQKATQRLSLRATPTWEMERVLNDVRVLLRHSHACLVVALADLHYWLVMYNPVQESKLTDDPKAGSERGSKIVRNRGKRRKLVQANYARKAWFYLAWVNDSLEGASTTGRQDIATCVQAVGDELRHIEALQAELANADASRVKLGVLPSAGNISEVEAEISAPKEKHHTKPASAEEIGKIEKRGVFDARNEIRAADIAKVELLEGSSKTASDDDTIAFWEQVPLSSDAKQHKKTVKNDSGAATRPLIIDLDRADRTVGEEYMKQLDNGAAQQPEMAELKDPNRTRSAFAQRREVREERVRREQQRNALPKLTSISGRMMGFRR